MQGLLFLCSEDHRDFLNSGAKTQHLSYSHASIFVQEVTLCRRFLQFLSTYNFLIDGCTLFICHSNANDKELPL